MKSDRALELTLQNVRALHELRPSMADRAFSVGLALSTPTVDTTVDVG